MSEKLIDQEEFEKALVTSKLSGELGEHTFTIPWETYFAFCESLHEYAHDDADHLVLELSDVQKNQLIYRAFKKEIDNLIEYILDNITENVDHYDIVRKIFKEEYRAAEAERKRIEAIRIAKEQEEIRRAKEAQAAAEANGISILVDKKYHKKATAILQAAGLIK